MTVINTWGFLASHSKILAVCISLYYAGTRSSEVVKQFKSQNMGMHRNQISLCMLRSTTHHKLISRTTSNILNRMPVSHGTYVRENEKSNEVFVPRMNDCLCSNNKCTTAYRLPGIMYWNVLVSCITKIIIDQKSGSRVYVIFFHFLADELQQTVKRPLCFHLNHVVYQPFAFGPRSCQGGVHPRDSFTCRRRVHLYQGLQHQLQLKQGWKRKRKYWQWTRCWMHSLLRRSATWWSCERD